MSIPGMGMGRMGGSGGRANISHNLSSTAQVIEQDTPTVFGRSSAAIVTYDSNDNLEEYYDTLLDYTTGEEMTGGGKRDEDNDVQEILDPKTAALRRLDAL